MELTLPVVGSLTVCVICLGSWIVLVTWTGILAFITTPIIAKLLAGTAPRSPAIDGARCPVCTIKEMLWSSWAEARVFCSRQKQQLERTVQISFVPTVPSIRCINKKAESFWSIYYISVKVAVIIKHLLRMCVLTPLSIIPWGQAQPGHRPFEHTPWAGGDQRPCCVGINCLVNSAWRTGNELFVGISNHHSDGVNLGVDRSLGLHKSFGSIAVATKCSEVKWGQMRLKRDLI